MKITKTSIISLALVVMCSVFVCSTVQARVGVGVGSGKIELNDQLRAGGIYDLPVLPVINTGDEETDYTIKVAFRNDQTELRPTQEMFNFEPETFSLSPGQVKNVRITLTLPINSEPGKYFALLSAEPVKKNTNSGNTSVGIAAASKLYFQVTPGNIWQGVYFRLVSLYKTYTVFIYIVLGLVVALVLFKLAKKYIHLEIGIKK